MRVLKALFCAAALTAMCAPSARADEWNKKTILTFSGPVQIPGTTLPAGSYVFKLADLAGNRHVVQVFDKAEKKIFATILAIPNDRLEASDKPVVLFSERASGSPQAVKVWYYPGERIGNEFVYPKAQAMRIAKQTHQPVLATSDEAAANATDAERMAAMKTATVGHFDESGKWQGDNRTIATTTANSRTAATAANAAPTTPAAEATTARSMTAKSNEAATGTSGTRSTRRHLPRTASDLALFALLGGLSLAGGLTMRQLRTRSAGSR